MPATVLIVDDSLTSRLIAKHIVQQILPGAEMPDAPDGQTALDLADGLSLDYALVDLNMPGMSGLDVCRRLQISHPDTRLFLVTANVQSSVRKEAESIGVTFIPKPLKPEKLAEHLTAK